MDFLLNLQRLIIFVQFTGGYLRNDKVLSESLMSRIQFNEYSRSRRTRSTYDFIVVGASPSGCVIANRLTEDPEISVLLLEAGIGDSFVTNIPIFNSYLVLSEYNWDFDAEPNPRACSGMERGICPWPAGKGIGGGSIMNAMIYSRGNFRDFEKWANKGNKGWSYKEVLPYFIKSEEILIKELRDSAFHGKNGSLSVSYSPFSTPLLRSFMTAGKNFGFRSVDYNNPKSHIGFSHIQATMKNGRRVSAASAFILPILSRSNFQIDLSSHVTKVLIDPTSLKAYGVEYIKNGRMEKVFAKKEVIISAGAFNSPQILMLSGIGHKDHLEDIGIPVLIDLPVGDNLQEHIGMHGIAFLINKTVGINGVELFNNLGRSLIEYFTQRKGILTSLGCEGVSYIKSKYSNSTEDIPDLELLFVSSAFNSDNGLYLRRTFGISDKLYETVYRKYDGRDVFSIWPMLLYPESKGYVRLRNKNPLSKVKLINNFLESEMDLKVLREGVKAAVQVGNSNEFKKFGAQLISTPFPGCENLTFGSDPYWECTIRTMTTQWHHQCCTCKMGSVVDSRLRVYGIKGLRVIDISIMPDITGSHTQAAAYMIGEKAADLIREDWKIPFHYHDFY